MVNISSLVACAILVGSSWAHGQDYSPYYTHTMDNLFVWSEQGLDTAAPTLGLPAAGIIHGVADPASTFLLQPYNGNNVLLLNPQTASGLMTLVTPTPAKSISLMTATGDGPARLAVTVHFGDGSPDYSQTIVAPNWIDGTNHPHVADMYGRLQVSPVTQFVVFTEAAPSIIQQNIVFPYPDAHPISSVAFTWSAINPGDPEQDMGISGPFPNPAIFGLSASSGTFGPFTAAPLTVASFNQDVVVEATAVPEPGLGALIPLAVLAMNRVRRAAWIA
jgi:hypothetical protein